jgi:hypothetical protein
VAKHFLTLLTPAFAYDHTRNAYILRGVGDHVGPVLRADRRTSDERRRAWRDQHFDGIDPIELDRRRSRRTSLV